MMALKVKKENRGQLAFKDNKVQLAFKVNVVIKDNRAIKENRVQLVKKEFKV